MDDLSPNSFSKHQPENDRQIIIPIRPTTLSSNRQKQSLKQWMTQYQQKDVHNKTKLPPILLLDGGVSTHLEQKQTFSNHELWSSSLLLTPRGRMDIQSTHEEFYDAGSNIVNTVSYQCSHHHCCTVKTAAAAAATTTTTSSSSSATTPSSQRLDMNERDLESALEKLSNDNLGLKEEDIDNMLRLSINLANQARQSHCHRNNTMNVNDRATTFSENSKRIIGPKYIAASIGCFGAVLPDGAEYTGDYGNCTMEDLIRFHQRRFDLFWEISSTSSRSNGDDNNSLDVAIDSTGYGSTLDAISFETVPSLLEVKAILHLLQERVAQPIDQEIFKRERLVETKEQKVEHEANMSPNLFSNPAIWISLACKDEQHLNDGTSLTDAMDAIESMDPKGIMVHGVGINCVGIHYVQSLIEVIVKHQLRSKSNRAIIFYPNSGEEWDTVEKEWRSGTGCTDPDQFAFEIMKCIQKVSNICQEDGKEEHKTIPILVGGCCRTNPETIAAIRGLVDEYLNSIK